MRALIVVLAIGVMAKVAFTEASVVKGVVVEGMWLGILSLTCFMVVGGIVASWKASN